MAASAAPSDANRKLARAHIIEALKLVSSREAGSFLVVESRRSAARADEILAKLTLAGDLDKPDIERVSGPPLSTEEAAKRLAVSAETIRTRIAKNGLVGYRAVFDSTKICLPPWQFDPKSGAIHSWVAELLRAFGGNGWGILDFVTVARESLGGANYLSLLERGKPDDVATVLAAARRTNAT
jgi:hypothetical protein